MSIQIGNYHAEGPFGNAGNLKPQSGVYVILGRNGNAKWSVVDVGESQDVRTRVETHDRKSCWKRQGHSELSVAAIYANQAERTRVEKELRAQFNPPCGKI